MGFLIPVPRATIPVDGHTNQGMGSAGQGQAAHAWCPCAPQGTSLQATSVPSGRREGAGLLTPSLSLQIFQSC